VDSLILQTAIGLVFVFATFAALVSVLTELIARFAGLRGEYLLRGIRSLVDGPGEFKLRVSDLFIRESKQPDPTAPPDAIGPMVMRQPVIARSADKAVLPPDAGNARLSNKDRRKLPSYISSRSFARALVDTIVPDNAGNTSMYQVRSAIDTLPDDLKRTLRPFADEAGNDIAAFRKSIEEWYDDHMARVSGWYKRHIRWVSLVLGAVLVIAFNVSAVQIARSLYTDQALRGAVVTEAASAAQCRNKEPADCLADLRREIDGVREAGLPLGWGTVADCTEGADCGWLAQHGLANPTGKAGQDVGFILLVLVGWGLMIVALLPGARFWFDVLARLGSLRSTGPKPKST